MPMGFTMFAVGAERDEALALGAILRRLDSDPGVPPISNGPPDEEALRPYDRRLSAAPSIEFFEWSCVLSDQEMAEAFVSEAAFAVPDRCPLCLGSVLKGVVVPTSWPMERGGRVPCDGLGALVLDVLHSSEVVDAVVDMLTYENGGARPTDALRELDRRMQREVSCDDVLDAPFGIGTVARFDRVLRSSDVDRMPRVMPFANYPSHGLAITSPVSDQCNAVVESFALGQVIETHALQLPPSETRTVEVPSGAEIVRCSVRSSDGGMLLVHAEYPAQRSSGAGQLAQLSSVELVRGDRDKLCDDDRSPAPIYPAEGEEAATTSLREVYRRILAPDVVRAVFVNWRMAPEDLASIVLDVCLADLPVLVISSDAVGRGALFDAFDGALQALRGNLSIGRLEQDGEGRFFVDNLLLVEYEAGARIRAYVAAADVDREITTSGTSVAELDAATARRLAHAIDRNVLIEQSWSAPSGKESIPDLMTSLAEADLDDWDADAIPFLAALFRELTASDPSEVSSYVESLKRFDLPDPYRTKVLKAVLRERWIDGLRVAAMLEAADVPRSVVDEIGGQAALWLVAGLSPRHGAERAADLDETALDTAALLTARAAARSARSPTFFVERLEEAFGLLSLGRLHGRRAGHLVEASLALVYYRLRLFSHEHSTVDVDEILSMSDVLARTLGTVSARSLFLVDLSPGLSVHLRLLPAVCRSFGEMLEGDQHLRRSMTVLRTLANDRVDVVDAYAAD